jgi:AcrR family transcriptional regulator
VSRPAQTSRADFIDAALRFIDTYGVDDLSLRSLSRQMEMSHATLYRHFANKDELIDTLIDDQLGHAIEATDPSLPARARLKELAVHLRNHFDQHPNLLKPLINGTGAGHNAFQIAKLTLEGIRELGIAPPRRGHWLRILENFVVGSMVYDYAAAPDHLDIRATRLNVLTDAGYLDQKLGPLDVAQQNRAAFDATLEILLSALTDEARRESEA